VPGGRRKKKDSGKRKNEFGWGTISDVLTKKTHTGSPWDKNSRYEGTWVCRATTTNCPSYLGGAKNMLKRGLAPRLEIAKTKVGKWKNCRAS